MKILLLALALAAGTMAHAQPAFPSAVATDANLPRTSNTAQDTLATTVDADDTTVILSNASEFISYQVLTIGSERIRCGALTSNTYANCERGYDGSTAAAHTAGAAVYGYLVAKQLNNALDEIKAVQTALGVNLANIPAAAGLYKVTCTTPPDVTCTFHDNTASTGNMVVRIIEGEGQSWRPFEILASDETTLLASVELDGSINAYNGGARGVVLYQQHITQGSGGQRCWRSVTDVDSGATDTCEVRDAAGVVGFTNGSGGYRDVKLRTLKVTPVTIATLPGSPVDGDFVRISDSATGDCLTGGGSIHLTCVFDGSDWEAQ